LKNLDNIENLSSIIKRVSQNLGVERGLKEITIINMWPELVGPRFKDKSRIFSIQNKGTYDVLLVGVNSASLSQELTFFKNDILKKLSKSSKKLGFNIKDIMFSTKIWEEIKPEKQNNIPEKTITLYKNPTEEDLVSIEVPESIIEPIKESLNSHNFASPEMKEKMYRVIIKDIKTQIWKKNKGHPSCIKCGVPVNKTVENSENTCLSCRFSNI